MATLQGLTVNDTGYIKVTQGTNTQNNLQVFKTPGTFTWTCPTGVTAVEVLVVAGGGGGGNDFGGGGGGGGVVYHSNFAVSAGSGYTVTVGAGGYKSTSNSSTASNGQDSVFATITAKGGGGGASNSSGAAGSGGSGGGAAKINRTSIGTSNQASFSGATSYGNSGGTASTDSGNGGGGGGGGAGGAGGNAPSASPNAGSNGGAGGAGISISIGGLTDLYGGGGGGGTYIGYAAGAGGTGGGGNGSTRDTRAQDGRPNTGGGGGGAGQAQISGAGNGGSGIVIIAWNTPEGGKGPLKLNTSKGGLQLEVLNTQDKTYYNQQLRYGSNNIVEDGLVCYLDAGNPNSYNHRIDQATWYDLSGRGNHATVTAPAHWDASSGGCVKYYSTGGRASIPSTNDFAFGTGDFTWEAWFQPNITLATSYNHILAFPTQGTSALKINVNDGQIYYYDPSYTTYGSTNGWNVKLDTWCHITLVRANGVARAYINGLYVGNKSGFSTSMSAQICNIGDGQGVEYTNKRIAVVRIYRRALTQVEILKNYKADYARFDHEKYYPSIPTEGLQSYFDFGNPTSYSGNTAYVNDLTPLLNPTRNTSFQSDPNLGANATLFGTYAYNNTNSDYGGAVTINSGACAINSIMQQNFVTVSIWLKFNGHNSGESQVINKESCYEWAHFSSSNTLQWALFSTSTSWFWNNTGYTFSTNKLYHMVGTFDGTNVITYVNGDRYVYTPAYSQSILANQTSAYTKLCDRGGGFSYQAQSPGNYTYYQWSIYDRCLSDHEVQQLYQSGLQRYGYWGHRQ